MEALRREMTDGKSTIAENAFDRLTWGHKGEEITSEFQEVFVNPKPLNLKSKDEERTGDSDFAKGQSVLT